MSEIPAKPDHRQLGQELDLFVFSDLVGSGLPLWTPRGTAIRDAADKLVWELRQRRGYQKVEIPHLTKKDLYETSGHWTKFSDELFKITSREGHLFAVKPMNCPHHIEIYRRRPQSYRDLPIRYANTTMVYRDEQTGELGGLTRVRSITQDDAHVFCRADQAKSEIEKVWQIIEEFYGAVGFDKWQIRLSFHDSQKMEKYLGTEIDWQKAENVLREVVHDRQVNAEEVAGEAAFYGPKIDFTAIDPLGREWQLATIQLDVNVPERFDLTCINEQGEKERIMMVHCAIMGSIERFVATVLEFTGGALPIWLAPVQTMILSVSEKEVAYAERVATELRQANIRVETNFDNETLGKKIRGAKLQKIPYLLIIGAAEAVAGNITIEDRDTGQSSKSSVSDFLSRFK
ncbi:MAG: threonine--tRNA ligase [Patescibacteria group bacterium]